MSDRQVALVTGATGTIGRAIATELGARGASLVITGRRMEVLADIANELRDQGVKVETVAGDVTDPGHVEDAVARANEAFGPITTLVNNAGGASAVGASVDGSDPELWRETLLLNVFGPYLCARAVLPAMLERGRGRIITVASRAGTAGMAGSSDYVVSKTAAIRLSEVIAAETRDRGVTAFSLHPGGVINPMVEQAIAQGKFPADRFPDPPQAAARMIAELAEGKYDILSGAYLDVHDDLPALAALAAQRGAHAVPTRALRVMDLPEDWHGRPMSR